MSRSVTRSCSGRSAGGQSTPLFNHRPCCFRKLNHLPLQCITSTAIAIDCDLPCARLPSPIAELVGPAGLAGLAAQRTSQVKVVSLEQPKCVLMRAKRGRRARLCAPGLPLPRLAGPRGKRGRTAARSRNGSTRSLKELGSALFCSISFLDCRCCQRPHFATEFLNFFNGRRR
jgi:hypothetical protein